MCYMYIRLGGYMVIYMIMIYRVQMTRGGYIWLWYMKYKWQISIKSDVKVKDLMIFNIVASEILGAMTCLLLNNINYMIVILVPSSTENVSLPQVDIDVSVKKKGLNQ